jgi:NTE family protein
MRAPPGAAACPRIDFLRVEPGSERYASAIEALFSDQIGKPVNVKKLERRVGELYGQGNLEILDYQLVQRPPPADGGEPEPGYGLALNTRRNSWGPNYLRFGLQLQNDFDGNSSFNAAARSTMSEITKYGGEWVVDAQVGETPRVATELYLPVGYRSRWFVMPHAQFQIRTLPLANEDEQILAEYRVKTADIGLDLGRELGNYGEFRLGAGRTNGSARVRVGDPLLPPSDFTTNDFFGEFRYDTLDNVNFPRRGASLQIGWKGERGVGGDSQDATCWYSTSSMRTPGDAIPPSSGPRPGRSSTTMSTWCGRTSRWVDSSTCPPSRPKRCRVRTTRSRAASTTGRLDEAGRDSSTCRYSLAHRSSSAMCGDPGVMSRPARPRPTAAYSWGSIPC